MKGAKGNLLLTARQTKMNKSQIFKAAHKLAKSVHVAGDCYRVTFGAAIKAILEGLVMTTKSIEDQLIEAGAKIWEKGNMKRIYINDAVAQTVFNEGLLKDFPQLKISVGKAKFYFDLNHNVFTADNGTIRTAINGTAFKHGFKCTK